ncbi:phosphoribosylglycinamide formyltransferase [Virgibacillus sp. W0181]|uniref:phosphoribosylglycinamide formyltransferase n=1 Tax=Virgibacillus sp. W0181 TaxID=3391581 RepID=UPI003F488494
MSKVRAAVFASGTGSNFEAIMKEKIPGCDITFLVCDQPDAKVIDKANYFDVPTFVFSAKDYPSKQAYERVLVDKLQEAGVTWIFLAGYMRMIGKMLLDVYEERIINIHPSLLPAFPGKDAIGQAVEAGVGKTGVTVHYVDSGMDSGPIIAQEELEMFPDETIETLKKRIQKVEHRLYPRVIKDLMLKD